MKNLKTFEELNENASPWGDFLNERGYLKNKYWTAIRNKIQEAFPQNKIRLGQTIPKSMRPWNIIISDSDPKEHVSTNKLQFGFDPTGGKPDSNSQLIEYLRPEKNDMINVFLNKKIVATLKVTPDQEKTSTDLISIIKKNFK